ncbi:hypothetical protein VP01_7243g1 [Puccinia sorghi]|uniref:Uncharacterized protein n=1 Tax=Puccinia sorghi TaxID=27349 RepID=A0A0L6UFB5_9BASI|nr:hypothetical protein VP01_7243g1 [Puccinia sorghi]
MKKIGRNWKKLSVSIESIWLSYLTSKCVDDFYKMCQLFQKTCHALVYPKVRYPHFNSSILGFINLKHNFHQHDCPVTLSRPAILEIHENKIKMFQVEHSENY